MSENPIKPVSSREAIKSFYNEIAKGNIDKANMEFDEWQQQKDEYRKTHPGIVLC